MKKGNWLMLSVSAVAAAALRAIQMQTGFDEQGLPVGSAAGTALIVVLVVAAVWFCLVGHYLPPQRDAGADAGDVFRFQRMPATVCAVGGVFLAAVGAVFSAANAQGALLKLLLAAFAAASAIGILCAVFALCREKPLSGVLLIPVCYLVVYLFFLYRTDAADPVLARTYVELLAVAALTFSSLERAAFSFRNGSPRVYLPVSAMAIVLSFAAAAERTHTLFFLGFALIEIGFLVAANF